MSVNYSGLKFRVSTALKNIIGRDLINDRFIAVFELVKNSYDAGANNVIIKFDNLYSPTAKITISDDGCGMSLDDIKNKWLFVAYSEKRNIHRSENNYRERIKRKVAGAKGVGRFSCDRLGGKLELRTKPIEQRNANQVFIDWKAFEVDDTQDFMEIEVEHRFIEALPKNASSGTILEITELREEWKRSDLLYLKRSLMKLVNPGMDNMDDEFSISIVAQDELNNDEEEENSRDKVNGKIINDIFEKLNIKTTNLNVTVSEKGDKIVTALFDRGEFVFEITEKNNNYELLKNISFSIFYLNRSAKVSFTRLMGIEPVNYGSIYVYKNGFRIYPYGEPGRDMFDIDRRKAQGYNRFLGTRELMGRIQILGDNDELIETTSRDGGLIKTPTLEQLSVFFKEKVLKTLEKYVVDIIDWGEPTKEEYKNGLEQGVQAYQVAHKVIEQFVGFARHGDILDLHYNPNILTYIDELKEKSLEGSLSKLEKIAQKDNNDAILTLTKKVKKDTEILYKQKLELEKETEQTQAELAAAKTEIALREKQNYFLKGITEKKAENLLGGMHLLFTYSEAMKANIEDLTNILLGNMNNLSEDIRDIISEINMINQKMSKISEYSIKGNFALKSDTIKNDIWEFINQYIVLIKNPKIKIQAEYIEDKEYICSFSVSSIGLIIDNIVSNSIKANARNLTITVSDDISSIYLSFRDDGRGMSEKIKNAQIIFDLGITTTKGFGLGLFHVKQMVDEMGGAISINTSYKQGFELIVRLKR